MLSLCVYGYMCVYHLSPFVRAFDLQSGRSRSPTPDPVHAIDNRIIMSTTQGQPPSTAEIIDVVWSWVVWTSRRPMCCESSSSRASSSPEQRFARTPVWNRFARPRTSGSCDVWPFSCSSSDCTAAGTCSETLTLVCSAGAFLTKLSGAESLSLSPSLSLYIYI